MRQWMLALCFLCLSFSTSIAQTTHFTGPPAIRRETATSGPTGPHAAHATNGVADGGQPDPRRTTARSSSSPDSRPSNSAAQPLVIPTMPESPPFEPHPEPHPVPPPPTDDPPSPSPSAQLSSKHQSTVAIVFEVLAGLAGLLILLALLRCAWIWRKTPSHDRVAAVVSRHQLEREMEEMERNQLQRRLPVPPPPPYQHAPAYNAIESSSAAHSEPPVWAVSEQHRSH